jgi:hypothetical protein
MDDIDKVRQGLGPVAQFLRERERIAELTVRWREVANEPNTPVSAQVLIDFCSPWKPTSTEHPLDDSILFKLLAPYYCFIKRHRGYGVDPANRSRQFIALKTDPKLVECGYSKDHVLAELNKECVSIRLMRASGSWVKVTVHPGSLSQDRGWFEVEVHNVLEQVTYPGTVFDVPLKEYREALYELMTQATGKNREQYFENNPWARADFTGDMYNEFAKQHLELTKRGARFTVPRTIFAFEYLLEQFDREGCAYAEYMENGALQWVFLSKFYDEGKFGHESRIFHGTVGSPDIEVLQVNLDTIRRNTKTAFQMSMNMGNSAAYFDPVAFAQFWRLLTIGRQIFVSHQSDN